MFMELLNRGPGKSTWKNRRNPKYDIQFLAVVFALRSLPNSKNKNCDLKELI